MLRLLIIMIFTFWLFAEPMAQARYAVRYHFSDKDTFTSSETVGLKLVFSTKDACFIYLKDLVKNRRSMGYLSFSIDSIHSTEEGADVWLYNGQRYKWANLKIDADLEKVAIAAGVDHLFKRIEEDSVLFLIQQKILDWLSNNGHPFATIHLDSIQVIDQEIQGKWKLDKGPLYTIDSIHVEGTAKISTHFLSRHLDIAPHSLYRKDRLNAITERLRELHFLEESSPWRITMMGTGATIHLFLNAKQSNEVNALLGFMPSQNDLGGKALLTGDVKIHLRNAIGNGESIGINWQQIQVRSPRLNLLYQHPYIFHSGYGVIAQFDFFKKDSSFTQLTALLGLSFKINERQQGRLFFQRMVSNQITVDTQVIKQLKALPEQLDLRSTLLGVAYQLSNTDDVFNPRKGAEVNVEASAGIRRIQENSILRSLHTDASGHPFSFSSLYDSISRNSHLIRIRSKWAYYFKSGSRSTIRLLTQAAFIFSKGVYRNEMFQIGGYRILRGFNEESIYTDRYWVSTMEYRYLIGRRSFLYAFSDLGWARRMQHTRYFWGNGMGVFLETKTGFLNIMYALGKQQETSFSIREGKIHVGFVSIF